MQVGSQYTEKPSGWETKWLPSIFLMLSVYSSIYGQIVCLFKPKWSNCLSIEAYMVKLSVYSSEHDTLPDKTKICDHYI